MIKLFFIHQLENKNGIERIPQLEAECVQQTFEEMREEGYEEDGLFGDMKLFFQPLTIKDDELKINPDELSNANKYQQNQLTELEESIKQLNEKYYQIHQEYQNIQKILTEAKAERDKEYQNYQLKMKEKMTYQKRTELNDSWSSKSDTHKENIDTYKRQISEKENQIKDIETARMEKEKHRDTINVLLSNQQTKIDRNLIQLHRGFIMYGPPGIYTIIFLK
jgi:uncharacterized protein (DUF3084 family)